MLAEIRAGLAAVGWLRGGEGRAFYPVGGAWRAVARLHMARADHPLHIIDGYRLPVREMRDLADVVGGLSPRSLEQIAGVSRRRRDSLPVACDLLGAVLRETGAKTIVFSAQGLREGHLFSGLDAKERRGRPGAGRGAGAGRAGSAFRADRRGAVRLDRSTVPGPPQGPQAPALGSPATSPISAGASTRTTARCRP